MLSHYSDGLEIGSKKIDFIIRDDSLHHYEESFTYTEGDTFEFKFYLADDGRLFTAHFTNFTISGDIKYSKITDIYNKDKEVWIKYEKEGGSGDGEHITLTQAEYNALSETEKNDPSKFYFIEDAPSSPAGIWIGNTKSNYSTEEKVIGTWTDGKPLYQITVVSTTVPTSNAWTQVNLPSDISVKKYDAYYNRNGSSVDKFSLADNSNEKLIAVIRGTVLFYWVSSNYVNDFQNITITLQYTKTTDTAYTVPVGDANYYSTSEQIVGRWIDGKPFYQKTIQNNSGITNLNTWEEIADIGGTCDIKKVEGYIITSIGDIPFNYSGDGANISYIMNTNASIVKTLGKVTAILNSGSNRLRNLPIVATLQYTKTTD
jgi:hypothetical protein